MQIIRDHIILINLIFLLAIGILGGVLVRLALGPKPENSRWDAKWIFWLGVAFIISGGRISGLDLILTAILSDGGLASMFMFGVATQYDHNNENGENFFLRMKVGLFLIAVGLFIILIYAILYSFHNPITDKPEIWKKLEDDSDINPGFNKERRTSLAKIFPRGVCYPYSAKRIIHIINQQIREKHIPYRNSYVGGRPNEFTKENLATWTSWFHNCHPGFSGDYYIPLEFDYLKRSSYSFTPSPFFPLISPVAPPSQPSVPLYFYSEAALLYILNHIWANPENIMETIRQETDKKSCSETYRDCSHLLSTPQKTIIYDIHLTSDGLIYPYSIYKIVKVINRWIRLYHIPFVNPSNPEDPALAHTFTTHHLKLFHTCFMIESLTEPLSHPYLSYYLTPLLKFDADPEFNLIPFYSERALRYIVKQIKKSPKWVIRFHVRTYTYWLLKQLAKREEE